MRDAPVEEAASAWSPGNQGAKRRRVTFVQSQDGVCEEDVLVLRGKCGSSTYSASGAVDVSLLVDTLGELKQLVCVVEVEKPREFVEWSRMVINPEIDQHTLPRLGIELTRNDDDRSRLSAAEVAASVLAGNQRGEQPPMERPLGLGKSIPHRFGNAGGGHHIRLAAEAIALDVASPL
jgi:hypothetical protein